MSFWSKPLFTLTFNPLNVVTTASIEEDSLFFEELDQRLTLSLSSAAIVEVRIHVSGFVVADAVLPNALPVFTLEMGQQIKTIQHVNRIGWYTTSFFLAKSTEMTLIFTNFATLEASPITYRVIMDDVVVLKRGL